MFDRFPYRARHEWIEAHPTLNELIRRDAFGLCGKSSARSLR